MFTELIIESRKRVVTLDGVSTIVNVLIEYMYTTVTDMVIYLENFYEILSTAIYLLVEHIVKTCAKFVVTQTKIETCVDILKAAEDYSFQELKRESYEFVRFYFEFSKTIEIHQLTFPKMLNIFKIDFPKKRS